MQATQYANRLTKIYMQTGNPAILTRLEAAVARAIKLKKEEDLKRENRRKERAKRDARETLRYSLLMAETMRERDALLLANKITLTRARIALYRKRLKSAKTGTPLLDAIKANNERRLRENMDKLREIRVNT